MKNYFFLILVFVVQWASAQLIIKPIIIGHSSSRVDQIEALPPLSLPFWDDFSYAADVPDSLWEFSNSIFINEAIAIDPPTYKAATFDGLDEFGRLYDENSEFSSLTDQLISRRIELASLIGDESVFLSFFWEAGGNGEMPEGADSLRLQLLNADSIWVTEWKIRADNVLSNDTFTQTILKVNSEYKHDDFRFKLESFGSQQGPFDTWHVDYIYLDKGRTSTSIDYKDRAFTGSLSSLIAPYREMPSTHFFADPNKYVEFQEFQASNLDVTPHTLDIEYSLVNTESGETIDFNDDGNVFLSGQLKTITLAQKPMISPIATPPDSVVFVATLTSNFGDPISPINFRINDTIRASYTFQNYYAYDDGVAEFAAGVRQNQGSVAVQYVLEIQDTLSHVDIYFPSISPTSSGRSVNVNVWKRLDGSSPLSSTNYTIVSTGRDEFVRIRLPQSRIVQDTIYVGFTQNTSEYIGVGVDRSNLSAADKVFYRTSDTWQPNGLVNGVLMIRPVFLESEFVLKTDPAVSEIAFYPNPTSGHFTILGMHERIQILSIGGKVLFEKNQKPSYDISFLKEGIYLMRIFNKNDQLKTFKLIKQH